MTFNEAIAIYTKHLINTNCRPGSINNARRYLQNLSDYVDCSFLEITPAIVSDFIGNMLTHLACNTVSARRSVICAFFNYLSQEEYIADLGWGRRIRPVKTDEQPINALSPDQARRFIAAAQTARHYTELAKRRDLAMIYMFMDTAVRAGELLRLRLDDVDIYTGEVKVSSLAKGRKARSVWLGEEALPVLKSYLRLRRKHEGNNLWVSRTGATPNRSAVLRSVQKYGRDAGISRVTIHMLRHTSITQMIRGGMPLSSVRLISGHANVRMVQRYTHLLAEDIKNEAKKHSPIKAWI